MKPGSGSRAERTNVKIHDTNVKICVRTCGDAANILTFCHHLNPTLKCLRDISDFELAPLSTEIYHLRHK